MIGRRSNDLLGVEADFYIAAGDQVTWGRGLERCGEILSTRGDKVYVLPGNHESASQIADMCARYGLHDFHRRHMQVGRWHVAGLGYSNPTPFDTPGEYSEPQLAERLERVRRTLTRWSWSATRRLTGRRSTRSAPVCTPGRAAVRDFIENASSPSTSSAATSTRPRASPSEIGRDPRLERRQKGLFVRIGLIPT